MNKQLTLTDVKLRVTRNMKSGHFWDGKTWINHTGRTSPVALCGDWLYPRELRFFMTPDEMKTIPFCKECLEKVDRG